MFKRPTKVFDDAVAGGGAGLRALRVPGVIPVEGGIPLIIDDKIEGAVGVSSDSSDHDGMCAKATAAV
jgi:glc operon protein GlcG